MGFFKPKFVLEWRRLIKEEGFKGFIKRKGWKVVVIFFFYYLIRDTILYIIIPYLIINNIIECG